MRDGVGDGGHSEVESKNFLITSSSSEYFFGFFPPSTSPFLGRVTLVYYVIRYSIL